MLVVDYSIWMGKELDPAVSQIVATVGLAGLRGPNGEEYLGCKFGEDGTWLVLEPVNGVSQKASDIAWRVGRLTLDEEGFRLAETSTLFDAIAQGIRLPAPYYSEGVEQMVANCVVDDAQQAKLHLVDLLTRDREEEMTPATLVG